jgi:hypothetical protein
MRDAKAAACQIFIMPSRYVASAMPEPTIP